MTENCLFSAIHTWMDGAGGPGAGVAALSRRGFQNVRSLDQEVKYMYVKIVLEPRLVSAVRSLEVAASRRLLRHWQTLIVW